MSEREEPTAEQPTEPASGGPDRGNAARSTDRSDRPARLGPYRILEELGGGGMGDVYLAEQLEPLERRVALKVLRGGRLGSSARARFELEGRMLARLGHPCVAQVYDAGWADGLPYLAMELVDGERIDGFADRRRLDVAERCRLMVQVCLGVEHAHRRGILHRDLKPANLLVVDQGRGPQVKIIDFGIAKALAEDSGLTRDGLVGTPEYMSPEQAESPGDVDTRSDVYQLGLVLYRLLAERGPFDGESMSNLMRRLREDVPRPSSRVGPAGDAVPRIEAGRRRRELGGDLDAIVEKALARDREARYGSASELAADLERFLAHRPVLARRWTGWYRFRKAVRRHRGRALAAALLLLTLAGGVAGTLVGLVRSQRAEERLAEEAATVRAINAFLLDMLTAADPGELGRDVLVRDVLGQAEAQIGALADRPLIEAEVRTTLARTWRSLGELEAAARQVEAAREGLGRLGRLTTRQGRSARLEEARLREVQGRHAEALALAEEVLSELRRAEEPDPVESLEAELVAVGPLIETGRVQEAESRLRDALAGIDGESPVLWEARALLARVHFDAGRYGEAEELARETLELQRQLGEEHPATLETRNTLAGALWFQRKMDELEANMEETLAIHRKVLGPDHPDTLDIANNLAIVRFTLEDLAGARELTLDTFERRRRVLGPEHPKTLDSMIGLGNYEKDARPGWEERALLYYARAWEIGERVRPLAPGHLVLGVNLADHYVELGRLEDASAVAAIVLERRRETLGPDHSETLRAEVLDAELAMDRGEVADGARRIEEAISRQRDLLGPDHLRVIEPTAALLRALARAAPVPPEARERAERVAAEVLGHFRQAGARENLGSITARLAVLRVVDGDGAGADELLEGLPVDRETLGSARGEVDDAISALGPGRSGDLRPRRDRLAERLGALGEDPESRPTDR